MMLTSDDKGLAPMDIDRVQDKGKRGKGMQTEEGHEVQVHERANQFCRSEDC